MTIHLPEDVERSINAEVTSGHFGSADEAIAAAWREFLLQPPQEPPGKPSAKPARPAKPTQRKKPMSRDEFYRHLIEIGLMSRLPDTPDDFDDPDDEPISIKGEPLSETVIRERR
jgi:Arc/MetJ-type ribon-helix-helix transcriptional regulator